MGMMNSKIEKNNIKNVNNLKNEQLNKEKNKEIEGKIKSECKILSDALNYLTQTTLPEKINSNHVTLGEQHYVHTLYMQLRYIHDSNILFKKCNISINTLSKDISKKHGIHTSIQLMSEKEFELFERGVKKPWLYNFDSEFNLYKILVATYEKK